MLIHILKTTVCVWKKLIFCARQGSSGGTCEHNNYNATLSWAQKRSNFDYSGLY